MPTDNSCLTVMGPDNSLSHGNTNEPPVFITGKTIKNRNANELLVWIQMMEQCAISDKMKGKLLNAGFKVYKKCDEQTKNIVDKAILDKELNLEGNNDKDHNQSKLIERIIEPIALETVTEKRNRKVAHQQNMQTDFTASWQNIIFK